MSKSCLSSRICSDIPVGTSDTAKIPQARLSSAVQQLAVALQTEGGLPEDAFAVPLQDMSTWSGVSIRHIVKIGIVLHEIA